MAKWCYFKSLSDFLPKANHCAAPSYNLMSPKPTYIQLLQSRLLSGFIQRVPTVKSGLQLTPSPFWLSTRIPCGSWTTGKFNLPAQCRNEYLRIWSEMETH